MPEESRPRGHAADRRQGSNPIRRDGTAESRSAQPQTTEPPLPPDMKRHIVRKIRVTRKDKPSPLFGQFFKPTETLQDRTTAAAKLIIDEDRTRRDELSAKLKEARLKRDERRAAEAAAAAAPKKRASRKKSG
ncbi:MAG: hypothetical protein V7673_00695 [Paracoccus sp. (in: a-proteobacteria)]|uniref:hypothetical protein n=1 Tax=Paracoccus sp. TaxID=267 RepID=UPI003002D948